jgi:Undecaprenyl-phosphate galactose phosphotransferase WbaP
LGSQPRIWQGAHEFGDVAGLRIDERLLLPLPRVTKRTADILLTMVGGVFILPLVFVITCAIKLTSPGPAFYSQKRIGRGGKHFRAWKFRTMVVNADQILQDHLKRDPALNAEWQRERVTWVGRFLRKTSLDELPQLWNVLRGEMSLVGPRPIVDAEIPKYGPAYSLYLRVTPGITGLWQISGRNNTTYEKRVELDLWYVRNWSIWFDAQILCSTIDEVLHCRGAY